MEERGSIDRETGIDQENGDEIVRQTSKLLDELFKTHSRHPEFIQAVIWCMRALIKKGAFSEENQSAIKRGVDGLAAVFSTKSLWVQSQIVNELYRYNLPELMVLLANAFRSSKNGVTVPVRLLLQGRANVGTDAEMFLPSYAMATGENSAFNLGLAADGPVREARKVPLEAVKKVSMSGAHTLFLTHKGEVYACGAAANFDTGEQNGKLVVSPIRLVFPGETLPIVDIAAGPHHSVFITTKTVYVCGINNNFCLGLKRDKGQYSMKSVKLPMPEGVKKLQLEKVFTNGDCTIVRSANDMWIVGKTPFKVNETFTLVSRGVFGMIHSNSKLLGLLNEIAVVYLTTISWAFPLNIIRVDYKNRGLKDIEVRITNNGGVLSYIFDTRPDRLPVEACLACVNGVLVELYCVDYHVTTKGDIVLMGYPGRPCGAVDYCSLFRGQVKVIEDKAVDDGFTEAYVSESNLTGLRVLLVLQEVPGAHAVSSFARSPDGKNLIYVTNSSTICSSVQWETADYAKLNEERELSCLDKIDLDFHVFDARGKRTDALESVIRARFPNVNHHTREDNAVWIEDLAKEVSNVKCGQIFRDYLVYNENRVMNRSSTTKAIMDKICHVLGVQCIRHDRFYQLGEPLDSLDKFVATRNCILISEEGVEIEFVRELLELQSSYFGVAVTYQRDSDVPRFRLCASEKVIRWALLSIIDPNYLRTLKTSEIIELLPFLDQYLLYAVTADAVRVIFERVNEFNVGVIFDLYESVPQLRPLIAEYFYNNLYLLAYWKNSAAASVDLIRDVFAFAELENVAEEDTAVIPNFQPHALEAPEIYILGLHRKAHWSLFRAEDVLEVLLGPDCDVALEQALLKHLQEHQVYVGEESVDESYDSSVPPLYPLTSPEPELVTTIRARLEEREQAKARRARKKSARKSVSEGVSFSAPAAEESPNVEEKDLPSAEPLREVENDEFSGRSGSVDEKSEAATSGEKDVLAVENDLRASLDLKEINEDLLFRRRRKSSSAQPESIAEEDEPEKRASPKSAWKAAQCDTSPPLTSTVVEIEGTPTSSKKKSAGRFTPKGTKFRDASNLLLDSQPGTHFAPWAGVASSPPSANAPPLMSVILQEEVENAKHTKAVTPAKVASPALKVEGARQQRRRTSGSVSWSETVPSSSPAAASPKTPSLAEIMQEEERRQREGTKRVSRPLQFIEDEERAIDELTQLYRENVGDEVVVRVERCASSADMAAQCPVWTNTPHFRA